MGDSTVQMNDFPPMYPPAYSNSNRKNGYSMLPQQDPSAAGYHPTPIPQSGYAPAPPVFQQQSSSNVVVVGNQPSAPQQTVVHHRNPRAPEYLLLTGVLMILCLLHGNIVGIVIFLLPALLFACAAQDHNNTGDYEGAKSCGIAALCCNILSIIYFALLVLGAIAFVLAYFLYLRDLWNKEVPTLIPGLPIPAPACCGGYDIYGFCIRFCR